MEVLLEGEENKIADFYDFLKKEENKPREAEVKEISELEVFNFNSTSIHVPKASEYSQALTFEQLGKGIPILKGMGTRIEGMDENISGMREEMKDGFDRMDKNLERLPKEIAKELRDLLTERK